MTTEPRQTPKGQLVPDLPDDLTVKLIGLGGVGSIVARYGAMFLASFDRSVQFFLIDGDAFEASNATRMYFSRAGNKATVVCDDLAGRFAETPLSLIPVEEYVTPENLDRLIRDGDIVLLCVDNHATRKAVSEHAATLNDVVVVSGGNDGIGEDSSGRLLRGTYGNCQIHIRSDGADRCPSLLRYHPEIAEPEDQLPTDESCTALVASVPQLLFANLMTACTILTTFWLYLCKASPYSELAFDIAEGLMRPVPLPVPDLDALRAPATEQGN